MQAYKIRIPNLEVSNQVQLKAFEMGYIWTGCETRPIVTPQDLYAIYLSDSGRMFYGRNYNAPRFDRYPNTEISWQDFLRIGEPVGYKLRMGNFDSIGDKTAAVRSIQLKLFSLGYRWAGNTHQHQTLIHDNVYGFSIRTDMTFAMYMREMTFNNSPQTEILLEDLYSSEQTITVNNKTNQIVDQMEFTLQLHTAPKKAKNLTVGNSYTGIYTDENDSQVDRARDAKYFYCVNDSGNEARYAVTLFREPVAARPAPPPPPPTPTAEQILNTIVVRDNRTVYYFNGSEITLLQYGHGNAMSVAGVNCSCGIRAVDGLINLKSRIVNIPFVGNHLAPLTAEQRDAIKECVFKKIISSIVENTSARFFLFSNVTSNETIVSWMDELCSDMDGIQTERLINPNSDNEIKAWILTKA
jgi:hypothetical protein